LPASISIKSHLIFLKYTSPKYRTYIINQYKFLHNNVNKYQIFYLSLLFNGLILYHCENDPIITNISLLVFCCFYLSVKFRLNQYEVMSIMKIKMNNQLKELQYNVLLFLFQIKKERKNQLNLLKLLEVKNLFNNKFKENENNV